MSPRWRLAVTTAAALALALGVAGYLLLVPPHSTTPALGPTIAPVLAQPGRLWFRMSAGTTHGTIASAPSGAGQAMPAPVPLHCDRFHTAGGTGVCVRSVPGPVPTSEALVTDARLVVRQRVALPGVASRARVSASGHLVAWTTFVTGDSYAQGGFSTRTGLLDLRGGNLVTSIEDIPLYRDGKRLRSPDLNYWGMTFAADDDRFYATVATNGRTYLVEGRLGRWRADVRRENVECPSLAADGNRVAFKKRVDGAKVWRLAVLDLATGRETELPGTDGVDDQALWLDDQTLAYGMAVAGGRTDIFVVHAGAATPPRLLRSDATSPAVT
ncbi:hypothetical protein AB0M36_16785 [Actinoplanes sp. NPDC051346]|uniref:hypothetical protein n=1 Tax=Actinoplanes sp. NPDC051346 TaxID=3155048 RepID=UPI0034498F79